MIQKHNMNSKWFKQFKTDSSRRKHIEQNKLFKQNIS